MFAVLRRPPCTSLRRTKADATRTMTSAGVSRLKPPNTIGVTTPPVSPVVADCPIGDVDVATAEELPSLGWKDWRTCFRNAWDWAFCFLTSSACSFCCHDANSIRSCCHQRVSFSSEICLSLVEVATSSFFIFASRCFKM